MMDLGQKRISLSSRLSTNTIIPCTTDVDVVISGYYQLSQEGG